MGAVTIRQRNLTTGTNFLTERHLTYTEFCTIQKKNGGKSNHIFNLKSIVSR